MAVSEKITNVGKDVATREILYTIGGTINSCSQFGKQCGNSQKIKNYHKTHLFHFGYLSEEHKNDNSKR